jgi:hypothetical protein
MAWGKEGIAAGDLKFDHGWIYSTHLGDYGTNYRLRAYVTAIGANLSKDAIYPTSEGPDVAKSTTAQTHTSCTSTRASCRPRRPSGR